MQALFRDIGYTLRQLRKSPGFALTTILTLTLTIAANVIVFGVVNAMLLHPLPVSHPEQLMQIQGRHSNDLTLSYLNYSDIRDRNKTFSDVAITRIMRAGLTIDGTAQPVWGYEASGNYFGMLGIQPALGRFFGPADDTAINGSPVAVLSYSTWQLRFHADPAIVGKTVLLNKLPFTVLGVAPRNFTGTEKFLWPEIWTPYHDLPELEGQPATGNNGLNSRGSDNAWVVGRLRPGITAAQADADLARVAAQLAKEYPGADSGILLRTAKPGLLGDALSRPIHAFLIGIMLLAALVLLAACANLGGLFAARTTDRARELGIRLAIGSSRWQIVRQLLTESVTISLVGGLSASLVSTLILRLLSSWHPASFEIPLQLLVEPGPAVYLVAALLALLTGLIFGLIPVRQVWQADPNHTLKSSGSTGQRESRFSMRHLLLSAQIALCCLLVTSAAVAFRGLQRAVSIPFGFQPQGVTLATLEPSMAGYNTNDVPAVQQRLLHAVSAIPGVTSAAYVNSTPLSIDQSNTAIWAPGTTDFKMAKASFYADRKNISPGYFNTAGTHLLFGRNFTEHDDAKAPAVAIVNETFARNLFGTANAVGKTFPYGRDNNITVVGIVEDGKYEELSEDPRAAVFWPILQQPENDTTLLVRSQRSPAEIMPAMQHAIAAVDPALPIINLYTWTDALSLVTFPARAASAALGILGLLAILLAITGIFGQANYTVSRRMRELGIRVALGAQGRQVLAAALGRIAVLLGIGSLAGLLLGFASGRLLSSVVYQATAADPVVLIAAAATMALLGLVAALIPARRALFADPAVLLRDE
jgi:predicted permease